MDSEKHCPDWPSPAPGPDWRGRAGGGRVLSGSSPCPRALVDSKMKELSGVKGRSSTLDLAVLTALNLGYELMELRLAVQGDDDQLNQHIEGMIKKLDKTLNTIDCK